MNPYDDGMLKRSLNLATAQPDHHRAKWLFGAMMATLGMFFLATLAVYVILRTQAHLPIRRTYEPLVLPLIFIPSTVLLLLTSFFLERSIWFARRERASPFLRSLSYAAATAVAFCALQPWGIHDLIIQHQAAANHSFKFYAFSSVLIIVHALHVLGGVAYIAYVIVQARRGKYDHERYWAVSHCAGYWHFLDLVWFAMLGTFWITG